MARSGDVDHIQVEFADKPVWDPGDRGGRGVGGRHKKSLTGSDTICNYSVIFVTMWLFAVICNAGARSAHMSYTINADCVFHAHVRCLVGGKGMMRRSNRKDAAAIKQVGTIWHSVLFR